MKKLIAAVLVSSALIAPLVHANPLDKIKPLIDQATTTWFVGNWCGYEELAEDSGVLFLATLRNRFKMVYGADSVNEFDDYLMVRVRQHKEAERNMERNSISVTDVRPNACKDFLKQAPTFKAMAFELQKHM